MIQFLLSSSSFFAISLKFVALTTISDLFSSPFRQGPIPNDSSMDRTGRWVQNLSYDSCDGESGKLSDFAHKKALVVAFVGSSCPISRKFAPTLAGIEKEFSNQGVGFIFVDPITTKTTEKDLRSLAEIQGFKGPVLVDKFKSFVKAFRARTTTEVFLLDSSRTILYHGPVDDQYGIGYQLEAPRNQYLRLAVNSHLKNRKIKESSLYAPGCELDLPPEKESNLKWTYHNRISRIIRSHCTECHRVGGVAPFSLESFGDVSENAGMIRKVVAEGIMPPWFASPPPKGQATPWHNDRSLPQDDKRDLIAWIKNGKPEGNPSNSLLPQKRNTVWSIGKPDAIFALPREINIKPTGKMPYVYLRVPTDFQENRWVQAAEVRPTAQSAVHHVIVFVSEPGRGNGDQGDPLAAYVPGNTFFEFPDGVAKKIPAGSTLLFQLHYTPTGFPTKDRTMIGLRFSKELPKKVVSTLPIANKQIRIPPNHPNHIETASRIFPLGTAIRAFLPHMHYRGKAIRYELFSQTGIIETLLEVPHFDFNWQLRYELKKPIEIDPGNKILVTGTFDNSTGNLANPDPNKTIRWGNQSDDEMLIGYVECEFNLDQSEEKDSSANLNLFNRLDLNKDGFLVKEEFSKPNLFPLFDSNKDGRVTMEEGFIGMKKLKQKESQKNQTKGFLKKILNVFR